MRKYNLPIFIPHRGCPHDCVFCSQRKITGIDTEVTPTQVREMMVDFLKTVKKDDSTAEVAFFGGSFTGLEYTTQEEFLKTAAEFFPQIDGIRLSTRPDYIDDDIINLLKKHGVTTVELGVQSSDEQVLQMNSRGHSFESVRTASKLIKDAGITLGHQMMLGMYGSTPEKDMQTVRDIISLKPACVRIYPVVTIKGTALEDLYNAGRYQPYTVEQAAELAKQAVLEFQNAGIEVIRVGLHSSEELENDGNIVAGPYHPAFGELVDSLIYRDLIEEEIKKSSPDGKNYEYICAPSEVSKVVGHKGINKKYFYDKYGICLKVRSRKDE